MSFRLKKVVALLQQVQTKAELISDEDEDQVNIKNTFQLMKSNSLQ